MFLNARHKEVFMQEARRQGSLYYEEERIEIYQDQPSEALLLRRDLKPITQQLCAANRRYHWIAPATLQVIHNGRALTTTDMKSGLMLLHILGLQNSADPSKKNFKMKDRSLHFALEGQ